MADKGGKIIVMINQDYEDLIPDYLKHRVEDIQSITDYLKNGDFENIKNIGHNIKGSGHSYGFDKISDIGKVVEKAAQDKNREIIQQEIVTLTDYLERVEVIYKTS